MSIRCFSHVAYRCVSARQTVDFYTRLLGLRYKFAVAENYVPSTGEFSPHVHIFLEVAPSSYLAFFELSEAPPMGFDPNTPPWVQHIALLVPDQAQVASYKKRLDDAGVETLGITDHGIFKSVYFRDPSGHRIEITCESYSVDIEQKLERGAWDLLEEWDRTKRAPAVGWHRQDVVNSSVQANGDTLNEG